MPDAFGSSYGPPPAAPQPSPDPNAPAPSGSFGSSFTDSVMQAGKSFMNALPGAHYAPSDPNASSLDTAANQLQQRIQRADSVSSGIMGVFGQLFAPQKVQAARDFIPQATEQLQQINLQRQHQADIRQAAINRGLTINSNQFGPGATDTTLNEESLREWKENGNPDAYLALKGAGPEWENRANLYMPEAMAKFSQRVIAGQNALQDLNGAVGMRSEKAYSDKRQQVIGALTQFGIKDSSVPKSASGWMAARGPLQAVLNQRLQLLNAFNAQQDQLGQAVPIMDEKVAAQVEKSYQFSNGEKIPGFNGVSLPGKGGVMGVQGPPGSYDTTKRGMKGPGGWSNAGPEQIETTKNQLAAPQVKGAIDKYKMARDFYETAHDDRQYTSAAGVSMINDNMSAIGRDIAEGTKASGGIGLLHAFEAQYGTVDTVLNRAALEASALKSWWDNKPPGARLSPPSIEGLKAVSELAHSMALREISDRIGQPLKSAGRYAIPIEDLGLDKEVTSQPGLYKTWNDARVDENNVIDSYPMLRIGDRGIRLPQNSHVPGAQIMPLDHSGDNGNQPPATTGGGPPARGAPKTGQGNPTAPSGGPPAQGVPNAGGVAGPAAPGGMGSPGIPGGAPSVPGSGDPPGRWSLPPGMQFNNPQAITSLANREIQLESGFQPKQRSPSGTYVGLGQWSNEEMARHGITDPDNLEQTRTALQTDIRARAAKLQRDGLPVTAGNVYLMHQQGETGLETHLRNPDGLAWQNMRPYYPSDKVAKDAIWDNMTKGMKAQFVARGGVNAVTSGDFTQLWDARVNGTDSGEYAAGKVGPFAAPTERVSSGLAANNRTAPRTGNPQYVRNQYGLYDTGAQYGMQDVIRTANPKNMLMGALFGRDEASDYGRSAIEQQGPAIGGTAGFFGGGAIGGAAGAAGGAAIGGAAGQSLKDWLLGNPQNPLEIAKQGALQGVLSAPGGRIAGPAMRMAGAGAVEGGATALQGGNATDIAEAAAGGVKRAGEGELFGRALGMASHKVYSLFAPDAQQTFRSAAADLHETNETLKTEPPKLPGIAGGADTANPKYEAAREAKEKAEATIKDMIPSAKPDEVAYAHKISSVPTTPNAIAQAGRPVAAEKAAMSAEYERLHGEMGGAGTMPAVSPPKLPDGPVAAVDSSQGALEYLRGVAQRAETEAQAPRFDPETKSRDLQKIRGGLFEAERDANTSSESGRSQMGKDLRTLADTIRVQQEKHAERTLGPDLSQPWIQSLRTVDKRYAIWMNATNGGKLEQAATMKGEAGRDADRAFRSFVQGDPTATAAWNYMRTKAMAPAGTTENKILGQMRLADVPIIGKVLATGKRLTWDLPGNLSRWMTERAAGSPAKFEDFVPGFKDLNSSMAARNAAGQTGARFGVGNPISSAQAGDIIPTSRTPLSAGSGGGVPANNIGLPSQTIIPPSSLNVQAAMKRAAAYIATGNNANAMQRNVMIMERGGPAAEGIANFVMKNFSQHPLERTGMVPTGRTINATEAASNEPAPNDASAGSGTAMQPDMPTPAQAGIQRPPAIDQALRQEGIGAFKTLAPRLYDYLSQPNPQPPQVTPNAAGKVPPAGYDSRTAGALEDLRNLALTAVPDVGPAARVLGAVAGAASPSAEAAQRTAAVPAQASRPPPGQPGPAPAPATPQPNQPPTGPTPTAAVPQPGSMRPDFTSQDMDRLGQLGAEIADANKKIDAVGKRSDIGPGGKRAQIDPIQAQIKAKQDEIDRIRDNVREQQAKFDKAGQPIGVRNPDALAMARGVGLGSGAVTGLLKGLSGKGLGRSMLYGGIEGASGIVAPNLLDLGAAPGTPARETAEHNLAFIRDPAKIANWDYARSVIAPEALGGVMFAGAGFGVGSGIRAGAGAIGRSLSRGGGPLPPPSPASPASFRWPTDPDEIKSLQSTAYKTPSGQWRANVEGKNRRLPKGLEPRS